MPAAPRTKEYRKQGDPYFLFILKLVNILTSLVFLYIKDKISGYEKIVNKILKLGMQHGFIFRGFLKRNIFIRSKYIF